MRVCQRCIKVPHLIARIFGRSQEVVRFKKSSAEIIEFSLISKRLIRSVAQVQLTDDDVLSRQPVLALAGRYLQFSSKPYGGFTQSQLFWAGSYSSIILIGRGCHDCPEWTASDNSQVRDIVSGNDVVLTAIKAELVGSKQLKRTVHFSDTR